MTQPRFTPIETRDEVRPAKHLDPPRPWRSHRPGEHAPGAAVSDRARVGVVGSDQGYALLLAERFADEMVLGQGEHVDDALALVVQVALRRASRFGRAPVRADLEVAIGLLSYGIRLSDDAIRARRAIVTGAGHDIWRCREIAESIPAEAVASTPANATSAAIDWSGQAAS